MSQLNHLPLKFEPGSGKNSALITSQWLPGPIQEVFDFFSRPENLQRLTPPQLQFYILTPSPIVMKEGLIIEYKLKVHGIPIKWTSLISGWNPPHSFTDSQTKGPYRTWVHTHSFTSENGGTRVGDRVQFRVPGGRLMEKLIVQKDLAGIFSHRHKILEEIFQPA